MRRFLVLFCLAIATSSTALLLLAAPGNRARTNESEVNPAPAAPSSGVAVTVQVAPAAPLPYYFSLQQNYPNPYNATTAIRYSCGQEAFVSLKVYNILGQEVVTLVAERKSAGFHTVLWDSKDKSGNSLASGIYLYRMIAGSFVEKKKLILLK